MKIDTVSNLMYQPVICEEDLNKKLQESDEVLTKCFSDYNLDEVFLSFNGGKDCTVLLDLLVKFIRKEGWSPSSLNCWYIEPEDNAFDEIEEFVTFCEEHYQLKINRIRGKIKDVLQTICDENPNLKAGVMGSRRTDPYCERLNTFQKTDAGWPDLMRINPVLNWTCDNIWDYIREYSIPYCKLYDMGYTSLGNRNNTIPNPHLRFVDPETSTITYRPAYYLRNSDHLERAGRISSK